MRAPTTTLAILLQSFKVSLRLRGNQSCGRVGRKYSDAEILKYPNAAETLMLPLPLLLLLLLPLLLLQA